MKILGRATYLLLLALLCSCANPKQGSKAEQTVTIDNPTNKVILSSDVNWEQLNPARGDKSPQAGTLWGDRKGEVATGFLAKFVDGFSSPPHIHNVTYRAVVIRGQIHNDDPLAKNMWMGRGSFWTQPLGEPHITSARGQENMALVEIDQGPYLVKPTKEAFDSGERPVNIDASNVVWLNKDESNWIDSKSKAEISFLMENDGLQSLFVKLPRRYKGEIETHGTVLHAVVIQGDLNYTLPQNEEVKVLDPGSYFGSTERAVHTVRNKSDRDVVVYLRTNGSIKLR